MKVFKLTEDLYTNFKLIDDQHRELFDKINDLIFAVSNNSSEVQKFIDFLDEYVDKHFGLEEDFMKKFEYPDQEKHLQQHRVFRERLSDMEHQYKEKKVSVDELVKTLEMEIGYWFVNHISSVDRKLTDFLVDKVDQ